MGIILNSPTSVFHHKCLNSTVFAKDNSKANNLRHTMLQINKKNKYSDNQLFRIPTKLMLAIFREKIARIKCIQKREIFPYETGLLKYRRIDKHLPKHDYNM